MDDKELNYIFDNLRELCKHLCASLPPELEKKIYSKSIVNIATQKQKPSSLENFEYTLCKKIEAHLEFLNKQNDVPRFQHLHRRLRRTEFQSLLTNRSSVLLFLLRLSELQHKNKDKEPFIVRPSLPNVRYRNQTFNSLNSVSSESKNTTEHKHRFFVSSSSESVNSVFQSINSTQRPSSTIEPGVIKKKLLHEKSKSRDREHKERDRVNRCYSSDAISLISTASPKRITTYDTSFVSEYDLIKELLHCFQGAPGIIVKSDHNNGFIIDPQIKVPHPDIVLKLMELGYLHNFIVNKIKILEGSGAVLVAVESAIRKFLIEYYRMIASLQSEYIHSAMDRDEKRKSANDYVPQTLCNLAVKVNGNFDILKTICDVINAVQSSKGGAAVTALYPLRCHGDPKFSMILEDIINHAQKPLMVMICSWMVEGELYDPFDEFFISINTACHDHDIWRNKFILRSAMIPNMISENQASMILRSGKAIKFLNVICEERIPIVGMREKLNKMKDANMLDLRNPRSELTKIIAAVSDETSKLVLDTLIHKFKLFQHFQGLRRYMLLGQGDFVNYFMDLVEPQMRKPASELQFHELMSLLGTAIRGSNAAYEDRDVIKRVIVKILVASEGDWGSDVFGLQYLMHETLDTALRISDGAYSQVFNFLWRTKRMESILLRLRKQRWATKNHLNFLAERIADVNGVIMIADKLNLEFLHFARQFHYYILFEVVECLWQNFLQEFKKARSFDDVIKAHDNFIKLIQCKTFHQDDSRVFINQFRLIWDLVYELEALEERFFDRIIKECEYQSDRNKKIEQFGTSHSEEAQYYMKRKEFKSFLASIRAQYDIINGNYQGILKKFLLTLSSENSHELTILSDRIDFNDYYKKGDSRISDSMKYCFCNELFT